MALLRTPHFGALLVFFLIRLTATESTEKVRYDDSIIQKGKEMVKDELTVSSVGIKGAVVLHVQSDGKIPNHVLAYEPADAARAVRM
jgi:hypothetical protein